MAKQRNKRIQYDRGIDVSLFPFLSIFLCVMGVLSFLNILNSTVLPRKVVMTGEVGQGYKVAYQIFCLPDDIIIVPPIEHLVALRQAVTDASVIEEILQKRRQQQRAFLMPTEEVITDIFKEIQLLNYHARQANFLYEEFVLFGLYPNSADIYHTIRQILYENEELLGISIGLEALDANWTVETP
ncbi:hypothetical protein THIOM_000113 [Candidatus Thiomargarita nelsonii]|uniref:Uncharacterized protein n=1 Tax=Candidatus Thiomargarita nelsonii TaxID=1003181 RepID=A0A176S7Y5_9GAMM|nr:hypothetical protein THIOM_000113 [Candidatus Thiomargarita nelsonii]